MGLASGLRRALDDRRDEEIAKLAKVLCDETDAAVVELGLANPAELVPFDRLPENMKAVYTRLASRIYFRLGHDPGLGITTILSPEIAMLTRGVEITSAREILARETN